MATFTTIGMLVLAGCTPATRPPSASPQPSPTVSGPLATDSRAQIYAAVIRRLVTKDHTFGSGASPFEYIYVVDGAIPRTGNPRTGLRPSRKPFPSALTQGIEERLRGLPPLEFISDPDGVRVGRQGLGGVRNNGVLISVGPIEPAQGEIHVATGLWCGGTCGQWLTYVLSEDQDGWQITGTTGPYSIS
jgi:hypothetical protein